MSNKNQIYFFIFFIIVFTILAYISYQNFCILNEIAELKETIEILSQKIVTNDIPSKQLCPTFCPLDDLKNLNSNFKSSGDHMLEILMKQN